VGKRLGSRVVVTRPELTRRGIIDIRDEELFGKRPYGKTKVYSGPGYPAHRGDTRAFSCKERT